MKVYLKIHRHSDIETIACCDEALLNQIFTEGKLRIEISSTFFGGDLLAIDKAIEILRGASYFNIVGENITNMAIAQKILSKEGVRKINNIPMAMKMMF
ncbi:MAG TPA: DUF424 family protein [Candidatus Nanopelagicaceae bacterium]|jgi:hypothetical protein|nr:DUF424 family protein [Candidatus Nanopelagicaceae bacterium]